MHYGDLSFPFKRYQIGKVYRGERPQKGRFREFYQCDIDIIGDTELNTLYDAELPNVIYTTFTELGFSDFTIHINNRKILNGLFNSLNLTNQSTEIMRIIDKLTKIGVENVEKELIDLNINKESISTILNFIQINGDNESKLNSLKQMCIDDNIFQAGLKELTEVIDCMKLFGMPESSYTIDLTIARGLDYYTGTVYETFLNDYPSLGSVCSGGRYDNLAEHYTNKKLPGVGISIGLSRLFYQLNELNALSSSKKSISDVLVVSADSDISVCLPVATELRKNNINTEIYMEDKKLKAKFKYADKLSIPFVAVIGENEIETNTVSLKNMNTGEQLQLSIQDAIKQIKSTL